MALSASLLGSLLAAAAHFSGLPAINVSDLPPIEMLGSGVFSKTVCPVNPARCVAMMAAFDTERYKIVMRDSLDMDTTADNSFLVHEMVHVLQYKKDGSTRFMTCEAVIESERQAFEAQNLYMEANGVLQRQGVALRYMRCPPISR